MALKDVMGRARPAAVASAISRAPRDQVLGAKARELFAGEKKRGVPVPMSEDLQRILQLPRRAPVDLHGATAAALIEMMRERLGRDNPNCKCRTIDKHHSCILHHLPLQAQMLHEFEICRGLFASAAAGGGKSMVGIHAPLALDLRADQQSILFVRASEVDQITRQYLLIKEHWEVPGLVVHVSEKRADQWRAGPRPGTGEPWSTLHIMSYDMLSQKTASDLLTRYAPSLIICDESDTLNVDNTRAKRIARYLGEHDEAMFAAWSGSQLDKDLMEIWHLVLFSLRERSPLPIDEARAREFAAAVNPGPTPAPEGALKRLCRPGENVRHALQRRMAETEGFIVTTSSEVMIMGADGKETGQKVGISVTERETPPIPDIVNQALAMVRKGERPDTLDGAQMNETLDDPLEQATVARQVALGMFYKFIYPRREPDALIKEWLTRRAAYNSEVREEVAHGVQWLDSPGLLEEAARRYHGDLDQDPERPEWASYAWPDWRDIRDQVKPVTKAVRLHPFLVDDAIAWARECEEAGDEQPGGIIWYGMVEFAQWIAERSGIKVYGGGKLAAKELLGTDGSKSIVVSIQSRGRGFDGLQNRFHKNLMTTVPASSKRMQQWLARGHRRGQKAGRVDNELYLHTPEIRKAFNECLNRAGFVRDMFKEEHKILVGWAG